MGPLDTANETRARLGPILVGTVLDSTVRDSTVLDGPLGFVGYAIGYGYSPKTGRAFGTDPGEEDGHPALSAHRQF